MQKTLRASITALTLTAVVGGIATLLVTSTQTPASAFPDYTKKEEKPCGYCHNRATGGGPRNYRGKFYRANNLTFAGFDDKAEAEKAGEPIGPNAEGNPKSWTAPAGAPAPAAPSAPAAPPPTAAPPAAPEAPKGPTVAELTAKMKKAEAAYKKAPKSAPAKKAYAASLANLGHATMLDQSIPPAKRYPSALNLSRKALTLDPANATAKADKKMIEDAYKSMGRPIPK